MKPLCKILQLANDDELFTFINSSFKEKITQWDYFVNWEKVLKNIQSIEKELNLLNYLIGKDNLREEAYKLIAEYPNVIKTFPILLAIRENSLMVLVDTKKFLYQKYNFHTGNLTSSEISGYVDFLVNSGIGELIQDRKIKNIVDYVMGVEVGLDSNARKNRGGQLMETLVEEFISNTTEALQLEYIPQATISKIQKKWDIQVEVDKSNRIIDFAINKDGQLFFIETNFYGSSGSKLKATATEYIKMNEYWNQQNIKFIWITDGAGWKSSLNPLREYFDKADYLVNLEMLKKGILKEILINN